MKTFLLTILVYLPYCAWGQSTIDTVFSIRYMVAYTDSIETELGGFNAATDAIFLASQELTSALRNSDIIQPVDLVRTVKIDLTESGDTYNDLDQLVNSRLVDSLRNRYRVDIVVLVLNNTDICGTPLVSGAVATRNTAFCAVNLDCMSYAYGLAHMVSHMFGTGHLPNYDSDAFEEGAFEYGHAYTWNFMESDCGFSTILTLEDEQNCCWGQIGLGPIIPYFSNPNVRYSGVPTGIDSISDNASVIRLNARSLAFYELQDAWSASDTVGYADLALFQGIDSLKNSNRYWVKDSAQVWFRAASRITLEPGFTAEEGTYFETILDSNMVYMR